MEEDELPTPAASTPVIPNPASPSEEVEETEPFEEDKVSLTPPSPISLCHPIIPDMTSSGAEVGSPSDSSVIVHYCIDSIPEADLPPQKRAQLSSLPFEIRESSAAATARQPMSSFTQGTIDRLLVIVKETNKRVTDLGTRYRKDSHEIYIRELQHQRQEGNDRLRKFEERIRATMVHTRRYATNLISNNEGGVNQTALDQLVTQRVVDALTAMEASRSSTQGDTSKTETTTRTCSYKEFCSCMQGNFNGTKGTVGLTRWFKKLKLVFRVNKVEDGDRVKYVACTMLDGALTWWNSYVRSIGMDAVNATPWSEFNKMLIKKYCP
ncbi:hypothetical protein Tco_0470704 [Tanacetum coccineum]